MKKFFLSLLVTTFFFSASSQRIYFVYLQSEQEQPFFLKMDEKIYSSTTAGYLILSRLRDSTYSFNIGFPGNKWPEQKFSLVIDKKDHGYLLKYFEGRGWGLFDLQNLSVQMAVTSNAGISPVSKENKDVSKFTDILSKAADDPTLKEKPIAVNLEEKKEEIAVQPAVKKEEIKPVVIENPEIKGKATDTKPVESEYEYKPSAITKSDEKSTTEGIGITYIDQYVNGHKDTIRILIPAQKPAVDPVQEGLKEQKRFLEITSDTSNVKPVVQDNPATKEKNESKTPITNNPKIKNNCLNRASDEDFFKLRKKMAGETGDYDMIDEARKVFKTKCFSVVQVKNLSSLFLTDIGKYMFFDAFYMFVSDPENYPTLQAELKDPYYINRFQAMLRN